MNDSKTPELPAAKATPSGGVRVQFPDGYVELSDEERRAVLKSAADCGADRAEVRADGDCLEVKYLRDGPVLEAVRERVHRVLRSLPCRLLRRKTP